METKVKIKLPPFFLVLKDNGPTGRLSARKRHESKEAALAEAERLSTEVGGRFYVVQLIAVRSGKKKVQTDGNVI